MISESQKNKAFFKLKMVLAVLFLPDGMPIIIIEKSYT